MSINTDNFITGTVKYTLNGDTTRRLDDTEITSQFHDTLQNKTQTPSNKGATPRQSNLIIKNISLGFKPIDSNFSKYASTPLIRDIRKETGSAFQAGAVQNNLKKLNGYMDVQRVSAHKNSSRQLGYVSAMFESGTKGIEAIGYDSGGGTCYGTYQISSKQGTMREFIDWLKEHEPSWASRLEASGPANTGGTEGQMPTIWKTIAREDAEKFAALQQEFINQNFYEPAVQRIKESTGVDISTKSRALRETLFSTAVQHGVGGAEKIFHSSISRLPKKELSDESKIIASVYVNRFKSYNFSDRRMQASLQDRMAKECNIVLARLKREPTESYLA